MPGDVGARRARRRSAFAAAAAGDEVAITYAGHSTYFIDTPGGVRIATDYSGAYQIGRLPDVVTMNRAHSHPLHAVSRSAHSACAARLGRRRPAGENRERIGDVFIRNVTTDIRRYFGETPAST